MKEREKQNSRPSPTVVHYTRFQQTILLMNNDVVTDMLLDVSQCTIDEQEARIQRLESTYRQMEMECIHPCHERIYFQKRNKMEDRIRYLEKEINRNVGMVQERKKSMESLRKTKEEEELRIKAHTSSTLHEGGTLFPLSVQLLSGDIQMVTVSTMNRVSDLADLFVEQNGYGLHETMRMMFLRRDTMEEGDIVWAYDLEKRQVGKTFGEILSPESPPLLYLLIQPLDDTKKSCLEMALSMLHQVENPKKNVIDLIDLVKKSMV